MKQLVPLDYGHPTAPPRELVQGVVRYGALTLLTGREGSGKSFATLALAASVARGAPWLGRRTEQARVLIVDQENPTANALERLYGLGMRRADQGTLRYLSQQGVLLTDPDSAAAIEAELQRFAPGLLIIDGAVSAGGADPNDNLAVARLLGRIRGWAGRYDLGCLLIHHVPKIARHDDPDAALGAANWRTQVDAHVHAAQAKPHYQEHVLANGGRRVLYRYEFSSSSKVRWGPGDGERQRFVVESERDASGAMAWLRVEAEGAVEHGPGRPSTDDRIVAALAAASGVLSTDELADAVSLKVSGSLRGRLARLADDEGRIKRAGHGWGRA